MRQFMAVVAAAFSGWLVVTSAQANDSKPKMTTDQIETMIKRNLPLRSSRDRVLSFLDQQGVEHSGHSSGAAANVVYGIFRDVGGSTSTVSKSVRVVFRFTNRRLSDYSFKEQFTGP